MAWTRPCQGTRHLYVLMKPISQRMLPVRLWTQWINMRRHPAAGDRGVPVEGVVGVGGEDVEIAQAPRHKEVGIGTRTKRVCLVAVDKVQLENHPLRLAGSLMGMYSDF